MPTGRTYDQYCAIARALDVIGDRWTLLIVRELLTGPKRYGALLAGLPGVATNLLADRLRMLEADGVIERVPGRGDRNRPYRLSAWGADLEPVLLALARWARPLLGAPRPEDEYRLRWLLVTLRARFDAAAAGGRTRTYEFRLGDDVVHVRIADGDAHPAEGPAAHPDVVIAGGVPTFLAWGTGQMSAGAAIADGLDVRTAAGRTHPDPIGALDEIRTLFPDDADRR